MPPTRKASQTIPPGHIEFRVYEGSDHSYYWRALRGGNTIARAGAYDRQRDAVREIRRIVAACSAGKVVVTTAPRKAAKRG
jgi:hypothetical protein